MYTNVLLRNLTNTRDCLSWRDITTRDEGFMNSPAGHVVATRAAELGLRFQSVNSGGFCIVFPEASDPSPLLCGP